MVIGQVVLVGPATFTIPQMVVRGRHWSVLALTQGAVENFAGTAMTDTREATGLADFDGSKTGVSVLRAEHERIARQRPGKRNVKSLPERGTDHQAIGGCYDTIGLALSCGGIRSAAFCTGALQGLAANGVMPQIDYLSTVSGGGYVGAALTVSQPWDGGVLPFLQKTNDEKTDSVAMRQLRNNANYLKFGDVKAGGELHLCHPRDTGAGGIYLGVEQRLCFAFPTRTFWTAIAALVHQTWCLCIFHSRYCCRHLFLWSLGTLPVQECGRRTWWQVDAHCILCVVDPGCCHFS
jgi:hypothetical protein